MPLNIYYPCIYLSLSQTCLCFGFTTSSANKFHVFISLLEIKSIPRVSFAKRFFGYFTYHITSK